MFPEMSNPFRGDPGDKVRSVHLREYLLVGGPWDGIVISIESDRQFVEMIEPFKRPVLRNDDPADFDWSNHSVGKSIYRRVSLHDSECVTEIFVWNEISNGQVLRELVSGYRKPSRGWSPQA